MSSLNKMIKNKMNTIIESNSSIVYRSTLLEHSNYSKKNKYKQYIVATIKHKSKSI